MINKQAYEQLIADLGSHHVTLVAVSKTKSVEEIRELYDLGQKDFGENYVQELTEKQSKLPNDIHWHFIGHLQTNKVKQIASFIHLIQSVDSVKLLQEINKQAKKNKVRNADKKTWAEISGKEREVWTNPVREIQNFFYVLKERHLATNYLLPQVNLDRIANF